MKGYRQKHSLEGKAEAHDSVFNLKLSKPKVFTAGSSMKPSFDTSPDMDSPIRDYDVHGVGLSGLIKNDLLRDTSNDQSIPNDTIEDRIATATHNVSMVILKCIDPKLQPLKKNLEASTSPKAN